MIYEMITRLVLYAIETGLIENEDKVYAINRLLELFELEEYREVTIHQGNIALEEILGAMLDYAFEKGLIKEEGIVYRDLFDTKIMGSLTPAPSMVTKRFYERYQQSPVLATNFYYRFSQNTDYIRSYRICKDIKWVAKSPYGDLDITINLSKPEKDPKAIAAAKHAKHNGYPKCLLCAENVGYAGGVNHPPRQNHRVIPITINQQDWGFQYSPYVYYNEHCIIFNMLHTPMRIDKAAFRKLLDFVKQFPHYFVGSNADLPIVGGSILSHDHFQGGNYEFTMAKAPVERSFTVKGFEEVEVGVVHWPMSTIRLRSKEDQLLVELSERILKHWREYTDESVQLHAYTGAEPHNTITPIARKREDFYEIDLVLRNNRTTEEYPLGLFHAHQELHHIKKENIGLIEVMGLAILPARLKEEMSLLKEYILSGREIRSNEIIEKHADWVDEFLPNYQEIHEENMDGILKEEIGKVFCRVLEDAGVYKRTPEGQAAFDRFLYSLSIQK